MSWIDEFNTAFNNSAKEKTSSKSSGGGKSTSYTPKKYFTNNSLAVNKVWRDRNYAPTPTRVQNRATIKNPNDDIAPVQTSVNSRMTVGKKKDDRKWYEKGLFEDGWDFGDVTKTILGINEDSASLKDLTVNSFKKGYYNSRYGEESFAAMTGAKNEKDVYKKILEGEEYQFAPGNEFAGGVSGAFELLGQQYRQFTNPRTLAFTGSAAGAAALAGQAGPQVLLPEEVITVPAAATAAFAAGSAASNFEIEAGHAYNEMIEAGIKEETARKVALGVGTVNASLEMLQVDELLDAYKVTKASGATKSVSKRILDELLDRGVDVAKETGQEVLQEGATIAGVQTASKLDKGEYAYSAEEVGDRLLDTAKSSALSFGMMNVPATARNTYNIVQDNKLASNKPVQNEQHPVVERSPTVEQGIKPKVEEVQAVLDTPKSEVKPTETKRYAPFVIKDELQKLHEAQDDLKESLYEEKELAVAHAENPNAIVQMESELELVNSKIKDYEDLQKLYEERENLEEYIFDESQLVSHDLGNDYELADYQSKLDAVNAKITDIQQKLNIKTDSAGNVISESAENSTVDQKTQLTEENSTVSEPESVDAKAELDKLYDERQVLKDTLESLVDAEDFGDNFKTLSERWAEVDKKIDSYESMITNVDGTTEDISPVPTPEPDAPIWFSEEIASVVSELSSQDTGEPRYGKMDVFEIKGYTIQRRSLKDGKRWHYSIISPDGTSRYNIVEADKNAFYGDVAEKLESIMRIDFSDAFEQQKPDAFPADHPVRVVSAEDGDYLKTDNFTEQKKPEQKRAKILTEMPKQKPKANKSDSINVEQETKNGTKSPLKIVEEYIVDNGFVFEKLSKKTKNRELEAKWDGIRRTRSAAQHLIGKGFDGVKSLKSMMETVEKAGLTQDFYNYLGHYRNIDGMTLETRFNTYSRGVWGDVSAAESQFEVDRLERLHPEFKSWAEDVYAYNNYLRDMMVKGGLISQKLADHLAEMYPHYVPLRRVGKDSALEVETDNHVGVNSPLKSATGGNADIEPLFNTMAERTMEVYRAVAMNDFGMELYNTLYPGRMNANASIAPDFSSVGNATGDVDVDYSIDGFDPREELLQSGKPGSLPTFSIFLDGERHTFDITSEMYTAMKPTSDFLAMNIPALHGISNLRRNLITAYNPWFAMNNAVKDFQEVLINSQHPLKTYGNMLFTAHKEIATKGKWYQEYVANGGEQNTYFDAQDSSFDPKKGVLDYIENSIGLKQILALNNYIEMIPRFSEYIASRESGRSVQVSMLDAARVTTNFGAGGKLAKLLDRNGCTFLNSSIQGLTQQVRNVAEAKQNGLKGWLGLAARYLVAGLPAVLLNNALWDDDEEYQALPDYITNNYYIPFKYGDGQFVRIPKGRTAAVIQNAIEQVAKQSSGDDEADWGEFFKLFMENIAPNNPLTDNIFAPIIQTATNTTWYGEDIIPYRLKDLPESEQFDEKTDALSIWLGEKLDYSPKKINYLIDQYSGVLGDTFLPYSTPKAESPIDNRILKAFAPFRDRFTTDSVLNNRVTGDFYETLESVEAQAESEDATPEDKLKSDLLITYNVEISKLMQEQRDIQTSDLKDSEKYKRNRELKEKINALQKKGLEAFDDYSIDGVYAEAGDKRFNFGYDTKNEKERWFEIKPKKADGEDNYYYQQEQRITKDLGISYKEYWNNREMYDDFYYVAGGYDKDDPGDDTIETARTVFGYERFAEYANELKNIKADYDANGEIIKNSKYPKVQAYVDSLDIPDIEKKILYTMQYPNYRRYKEDIVKYLDKNDDISYESFYKILDELNYKVDSNGYVTW